MNGAQIKHTTSGNQNNEVERGRGIKVFYFLRLLALLVCLLFVPGIIFYLGIDGDLHVESAGVVILDYTMFVIGSFALGIKNAALAVTVDFSPLLSDVTDSVGLVRMRIDVENRVSGLSVVRARSPGGSCRRVGGGVGSREGTTSDERATDGEDDAHSHGGGENGGHAGVEFRVGAAARVIELT